MICPNCYSSIANGSHVCLRCDYIVSEVNSVADVSIETFQQQHTQPIYLTNTQKNILRWNIVPFTIYGCLPLGMLILVLYLMYESNQTTTYQKMLFTIIIVLFFVIPVGFGINMYKKALALLQDAQEGIALQQTDILKDKHLTRRKNVTFYYGEFQNIGRIDLNREQYVDVVLNNSYRVTYSPRSKHIWNVEDPYLIREQD